MTTEQHASSSARPTPDQDGPQQVDTNHKSSEKDIEHDAGAEEDQIEPVTSNQEVSHQATKTTSTSEAPYSSFEPVQKKFIVFTATMGAFFSPFSTQIYFPALNGLAKDLHVTDSKINLTVTTYMILQAIAPAFIGGFSDNAGRRPAHVVCFIIYIAACIALALQRDYIALLILRMVQSAGSSGTVALANAVVADMVTSAERGVYIGITSLAAILAPSLGPILGGILSQYAGWQWIFWFLAVLAVVYFIPLLLFFPETCRKIVGDGSIPPPAWNRSLLNNINERRRAKAGLPPPDYTQRDLLTSQRKVRFPNPLGTLKILADPVALITLLYASIIYAVFYAILSGMPSQFSSIYGYDSLKIGLMYLPISGGSLLSAFTTGKLIDRSYALEARRLDIHVTKSRQQDLTNFPIEKARLSIAFPMIVFCSACTIAYGWILHFETSVAGPIILLVFLGYTLVAVTQTFSILIVDVYPKQAGTATASYNLLSCLLGAGSTAVVVPMAEKMGLGWCYTFGAGVYLLFAPMLWVVVRWGPGWRRQRLRKEREREEEKEREGWWCGGECG